MGTPQQLRSQPRPRPVTRPKTRCNKGAETNRCGVLPKWGKMGDTPQNHRLKFGGNDDQASNLGFSDKPMTYAVDVQYLQFWWSLVVQQRMRPVTPNLCCSIRPSHASKLRIHVLTVCTSKRSFFFRSYLFLCTETYAIMYIQYIYIYI